MERNEALIIYAKEILKEYNCPEDAYKGQSLSITQSDLFGESIPTTYNGFVFTLKEVAQALIDVGNAVPPPSKKPYKAIWSTDNSVDGVEVNSVEEGKSLIIDWYVSDMVEISNKNPDEFTEEEKEDWDYWYENTHGYIIPNIDNPSEDDEIYLTDEELEEVGVVDYETYLRKYLELNKENTK